MLFIVRHSPCAYRVVNFLKKNIIKLVAFVLLISTLLISYAENYQFPLNTFLSHRKIIERYCNKFDLDYRLYISVIYGELINNYNTLDHFDETRAYLGFNPSIGFSQIRISTIRWIESNYSNLPGISQSANRKELINKGINDTTNILYSVLYIKLIEQKLANYNSVKSIGSYYGKGIDNSKAIDINYSNVIGDSAESFFFSNKLSNVFQNN